MKQLTESQQPTTDKIGEIPEGPDFSRTILSVFCGFAESFPVPGFLIDEDHRIVCWNHGMEDLTGIKRNDAVGAVRNGKNLYGDVRPCLADILIDKKIMDLPRQGLCVSCEPGRPADSIETTVFLPHRGICGTWLHIVAIVIRTPDGSIIGAMETIEDVTDQEHVVRELNLASRKLELMNDMAWHEIQNKITGIRGYVELSRDVIHDDAGRVCIEAEENVLRQIHELLDCTRDYQEIGLPNRWISVRDTLSSSVSSVENEYLIVDLNVNRLELFADPALGKMLFHLIRYSSKNGKPGLKIRVHYDEKADSLELIYEDNGTVRQGNTKTNLDQATMVKYRNFCLKLMDDVIEFSGMTLTGTGDPGRGARFVIVVPKDRYRFG